MFDITRKKDAAYALVVLLLFCIPALLSWNSKTQLGAIIESGTLKFVTRNSPSTYFIEKSKPAGFEYDLIKAYTEQLGVKLELVQPTSFGEIFTTMEKRNGHIAGAMLTATAEREETFNFSTPYLHTSTALIYRTIKGQKAPKNLEDLIKKDKKLVILANSSHAELLKSIQTPPSEFLYYAYFVSRPIF